MTGANGETGSSSPEASGDQEDLSQSNKLNKTGEVQQSSKKITHSINAGNTTKTAEETSTHVVQAREQTDSLGDCIIVKDMPSCPVGSFAAALSDSSFTEEEYRKGLNSFTMSVDAMIGISSPKSLPGGLTVDEAKHLLFGHVCNTMFPKCKKTQGKCTSQKPCRSSIENFHKRHLRNLLTPEMTKSVLPGGKYEEHLKLLIGDKTSVQVLQRIAKVITNVNSSIYSTDAQCFKPNGEKFRQC